MTLPRWKLTTGLLGLSLGGLVATADPPCPGKVTATGGGCGTPPGVVVSPPVPAPTLMSAVQVAFQPPVEVPPPKLPDVASATPSLPDFQLVKADPPRLVESPKIDAPKIELPNPAVPPKVVELELPKVELPATPPPANVPAIPTPSLPVAAPVDPPKAVLPKVDLPVVKAESAPPIAKAEPAPPLPDPTPAKPEPAPPTATIDPAVKVTIHLGDGSPRFDVLAGDDTLLKVVCDGLDVKTPGDKGRTMSALKATKNVKFTATWCEGTCGELSVLADTGEVVLTGDVRVRTKKGKGETQIVASQMTFKLGSAPAYTVADPAAGGVTSASFRK